MPDAVRRAAAPPNTAAAPPDRPVLRLALFGAVLVVVLAAGFGVGRLTGPPDLREAGHSGGGPHGGGDPSPTADHTHPPGTASHSHGENGEPHSHGENGEEANGHGQPAPADAGGLSLSAAGFTMVAADTVFRRGAREPFRFRVVDAQGRPVTRFATVHDKPMHLIVVRRDLAGYQHLHPTMAADGTWSADLRLGGAGSWRAFADFTVAGPFGTQRPTTLGVDLTVPGEFPATALPPASPQATVAGYTVRYEGAPRVGSSQPLLFRVLRGGVPVTVEPYLGARGHLVVLRRGDLGYVHVHPEAEPVDGAVKFWLAAPSPGTYRMFFDFKAAGKVHTAAFTVVVP